MKEAIRQRARELGFDLCRFTTAQPPESAPAFERWLARKNHGEMGYLERNARKRLDPGRVLSEARSIITLACGYGSEQPPAAPGAGVVARYARGRDYHDVLGERLKILAEFVSQQGGGGARSLWYVDTGPFLERDLAQRAGVGFIGKHTNLISRELGNWLFLCEIITTLELEPDAPERNRCGSCVRCITACPTGAIKSPFELDARLCISYLTIELKGSIPVELRPAIGNRIFGCDDCLAACPWNRFARSAGMMKAYARADLAAPDLLELLSIDEAEFKKRFGGTPLARTKRRGLLRNVCVALGNSAGREAIRALERAAAEPDALIAEHARWAIDHIIRRDSAVEARKAKVAG
jgi:epoxyqueuosine reductase